MKSSSFTRARADYARLSQKLAPDDPVLVAVRLHMNESFVVEKIAQVLDKGPALTPDLRVRIDAVLAEREMSVVA
jgi:hypothetical protein